MTFNIDENIYRILQRARDGLAPSKTECIAMLECPPTSSEASIMRAVADALTRQRFQNQSMVFGQIGIEIHACPGKCKFCTFGEGHTKFESSEMSFEDILVCAQNFIASGELNALFLMTMHTFDFKRLIDIICMLREKIPPTQQIVVNIGDIDCQQAIELRKAGISGAYHVCRLREGVDTALDPQQRKDTIKAIIDAGLDWYYCCEPIGPEHSSAELVEQLFLGIEYGCVQHAAMRRVYVDGMPLAQYGQISELRLAQVTAVVALASMACPQTKGIGVHEPNLIGLTSGANVIYAETGANPRDTEEETTGHRGRDIQACKTMLYEAGFEDLVISTGEQRSLTGEYKH